MTAPFRTAEDAETSLTAAADAVLAWYSRQDHEPGDYRLERAARKAVWYAARLDSITPAQIAARARVRQLLVAQLVDDDELHRVALIGARHDAELYRSRVMDAIRDRVLAEYAQPRASKTALAERWGISRPTLDQWIGKADLETITPKGN